MKAMLKYFAIILFNLVFAQSFAQTWSSPNPSLFGIKSRGYWATERQVLPNDTTSNKINGSIAWINNIPYIKNISKWERIALYTDLAGAGVTSFFDLDELAGIISPNYGDVYVWDGVSRFSPVPYYGLVQSITWNVRDIVCDRPSYDMIDGEKFLVCETPDGGGEFAALANKIVTYNEGTDDFSNESPSSGQFLNNSGDQSIYEFDGTEWDLISDAKDPLLNGGQIGQNHFASVGQTLNYGLEFKTNNLRRWFLQANGQMQIRPKPTANSDEDYDLLVRNNTTARMETVPSSFFLQKFGLNDIIDNDGGRSFDANGNSFSITNIGYIGDFATKDPDDLYSGLRVRGAAFSERYELGRYGAGTDLIAIIPNSGGHRRIEIETDFFEPAGIANGLAWLGGGTGTGYAGWYGLTLKNGIDWGSLTYGNNLLASLIQPTNQYSNYLFNNNGRIALNGNDILNIDGTSGTGELDASSYPDALLFLQNNVTLDIQNMIPSSRGIIIFTQDAGGGNVVTFPAGSRCLSGTLGIDLAANAPTFARYFYDGTNIDWEFSSNTGGGGSTPTLDDVYAQGTLNSGSYESVIERNVKIFGTSATGSVSDRNIEEYYANRTIDNENISIVGRTGIDINDANTKSLSTSTTSNSWYMSSPNGTLIDDGITTTHNASAVLELASTSKGFIAPKMTTTQRNAIASPTDGLVISNITTHTIDWYNGTSWQALGTGSSYTDEQAQDAVGAMVDATLVYVDATPSLGRAAISGDVVISAGSNTAAIGTGVIVNADINSSAAIDYNKLNLSASVVNADINASAGIDASKIGGGGVSTTEFNYLGSVTSDIQTQLNGKQSSGSYLLAANNLSDLTTPATARINLGATTIGGAIYTLTNPSAVTFPRFNADNTVDALSASSFRTAIGAGTGNGDALVANPLSQFATTTSTQLNSVLSDESGTGNILTTNGSAASLTSFPTFNQNTTGSAATLTTSRNINGVAFNGSADITVTVPVSTGVSGLGSNIATWLATPSSSNLASAVTDETGTGAVVFANSPTLVTPALGTPSSVNLSNATALPLATGTSGILPDASYQYVKTALGGSYAATNTVTASTTQYLTAFGSYANFNNENVRTWTVPALLNGTVRSLTITTGGTQPASGSLVITFRKNATGQTLTLTIAASTAAGTFTDNTHSFSISAGDLLSIEAVNNATAASAPVVSVSAVITNY